MTTCATCDPSWKPPATAKPARDTRGPCAVCGRVMHVRDDGTMRKHRADGRGCDGSNRAPRRAL